jgi:NADH-quinone oxidoreductase subunit L
MFAFWVLVLSALFTSFYSWRLMFLTFWGEPRGDHHTHDHAHESPRTMLIPLAVLAVGAIFAGMVWKKDFFGHTNEVAAFFGVPYEELHGEGAHHYAFAGAPGEGAIFVAPDNTVLDDAHEVPKWVKVAPFAAMLIGLLTAFQFYIRRPDWPRRLAENQRPLYLFLLNKWYFDEIYDFLFVRPTLWLGRFLWKRGDGGTIDGAINGVAMGVVPFFTRLAGRAQSGYIFTYAFAMVVGIAVLITWMTIAGGTE